MLLADAAVHDGSGIICTLLLIAVIVLFFVGLFEALRVINVSGSRFGVLIASLIALVVYLVLC